MCELHGIRPADFAETYEAWLERVYSEDAQTWDHAIQAALRGEHEYALEYRIVRPDGSVRHIQAASQTFRRRDGSPRRMIGTNIDITERRLAEASIAQQAQRLEALLYLHEISGSPTDEILLNAMLTRRGYTVLEAADGEEAVAIFERHRGKVDLLLLDAVMPRMSGKEALDRIRQIEPGAKAIFLSGYTGDDLDDLDGSEPLTTIARKPLSYSGLCKLVREMLDRWQRPPP